MKSQSQPKIEIAAKIKGPGPAKYGLPATVGHRGHDPTKKRLPAYTFGSRCREKVVHASPGPCYFINRSITKHGKYEGPSYTISGKAKDLPPFKSPAPGNYKIEKCPIPNNQTAPSYSFGAQTRAIKKDTTPAPNAYMLPTLIGGKCASKKSAAAYSVCSRPLTGAYYQDLQKTPGPGTYNTSNAGTVYRRYPAYSLQGRNYGVREKNWTPGPGKYNLENTSQRMRSAPAFSFGIRHTEHMATVTEA